MAFSLRRGEAIDEAAARIVRSQTNAALAALLTADAAERQAVALEARKRCKKVRGFLRLVRGPLGDHYRPADEAYRAVAHALAARRQADANLVTLDRLVAGTPADALPSDRFCQIRRELVRRAAAECWVPPTAVASTVVGPDTDFHAPISNNGDSADDPAATAARLLSERLDDIDTWTFGVDGWPALDGGFRRTYRQGTKELDALLVRPSPDGFHDLRKRVKYTWYHLRLLRRAAPSVLVPMADQFHRLAMGLGDANDLVELAEHILATPDAFGGETVADNAIMVIDERRTMVEDGCLGLAVRLYAESPADLTDRLGNYWGSWQRYGDEQPLRSLRTHRAERSSSRTAP